ncbi:uncharacterized protein LOC144666905 [Oculina patagonica]
MDELSDIFIPKEWKMVQNNPNSICFVRLEKWEFNKIRASTEVVVTRPANSANAVIVIKAHGCEKDLSDIPGIQSLPVKERVAIAINYVEKSSFCAGISLPLGESLQVYVPHISSTFKELEQETLAEEESKAYSLRCKVFSLPGSKCSECRQLEKLHKTKLKRREKRVGIHVKCNKRYLSKEEVVLQLHQERKRRLNAEKREKYWRDKFHEESIEIESRDHDDLSSIFQGLPKEKVPEEMACFWEQQKRILNTTSKRGYRWHPKIIRLCIDLYCKNPHVLDPLREFITLPSNRTIRFYKNKVDEKPGWNDQVLRWCLEAAQERGLKKEDYWGGFLIDEMKIQVCLK